MTKSRIRWSLPLLICQISMCGCSFFSRSSMTTRWRRPVSSSSSSDTDSSSTRSTNRIVPSTSAMIGLVYGSQLKMTWSRFTSSPSFTIRIAPSGTCRRAPTLADVRSADVADVSSPSYEVTICCPSTLVTTTSRSPYSIAPATLLLRAVCSAIRAAVPPMWKVRSVSCVPGSPIDCAAMMPTASPMSTIAMVARLRP